MAKSIIKWDWIFFKKALKIITPLILAQIIVVGISFIDSIMVSGFQNQEALSRGFEKVDYKAVGLANEIWFSCQAFYFGTAVIFSVLYSQFANNKKIFVDTAKVNFWVSIIVTIFVSSIMYFLTEPLVNLFFMDKVKADVVFVKPIAIDYLKIMALGNLMVSLSWAILNPLSIKGKTKYPLYISIVSIILNLILDYLFIYVFKWGANGSAWATIISYAAQLLLVLRFINIHKKWFQGFWNLFNLNYNVFKEVYKRSFILITYVVLEIGLTASSIIYSNLYGSQVIAPISVGYTVSAIMFTIFAGVNKSVKIFIGPLLGDKKFKEAKEMSKKLLAPNLFLTAIFLIMTLISSAFFPQAMLNDPNNIRMARNMILIFSGFLFFYMLSYYYTSIIQTAGFQLLPNIFNYTYQIWASLPMIFIFSHLVFDWSFTYNLLMTQVVYIFSTAILFLNYRRYKWLRKIKI